MLAGIIILLFQDRLVNVKLEGCQDDTFGDSGLEMIS